MKDKIKEKEGCPWCSYVAKAYTASGLEHDMREHALDEHKDLYEKFLKEVDEWEEEWDERIEDADSLTESMKLRVRKFMDDSPRPQDVL